MKLPDFRPPRADKITRKSAILAVNYVQIEGPPAKEPKVVDSPDVHPPRLNAPWRALLLVRDFALK